MFEIWNVLFSVVSITAFVSMMMLIIEYLNVATEGVLIKTLSGSKLKGYVLGALLGATPGCLGAFAMVSLYSHRRVTIGAIVATMIATSGDEAFVMMGLFPKTALIMFGALALFGVAAGWLTDSVILTKHSGANVECCNFQHHPHHETTFFNMSSIKKQWQHPSAIRSILIVTLSLFLALMFAFKLGIVSTPDSHNNNAVSEHHVKTANNADNKYSVDKNHSASPALKNNHEEHSHGTGGWTWYTLVLFLLFGLFIVATVSDHFLNDHLWKHVFKSHVPRIFLWTLGAMTVMAVMDHFIDLSTAISNNLWLVLLIATAIGLIPESGPHLVFVTFFAQGMIPLSILVASSIVQDGHGMVPLLAHSRKDFITVKTINAALGFAVGALMLLFEHF